MAVRRLVCLLVALGCGVPALAADATLEVVGPDGVVEMRFPVRDGTQWCLVWNHSVAGFTVTDCFVWRPPRMILESSHQPDFAAGLGHIPGRGAMLSDAAGGYLIEGIDQPIAGNALGLRVGSAAVDHRLEIDGTRHSLSARLAGSRATLRVVVEP